MKNVFKIFLTDAKRLSTNVVATVVIIGLAIIPSLYAWFNILSNWDPYSEEATGNLCVAVASDDMGMSIEDFKINVGDIIIDNLKENKSIKWVFTDSSEDAIDGVYSGDYYAALVISESFSQDIISFMGGDLEHPTINFYENQKKNAIAPKITSKVKTTLQDEVNGAFVSALAEAVLSVSNVVVADRNGENLTTFTIDKLYDLDGDLTACLTIIDSYVSLIDATSSVMDASKQITDELDSLKETGKSMTNAARATTDAAESTIDSASDMVNSILSDTNADLSFLSDAAKSLGESIEDVGTITNTEITTLQTTLSAIQNAYNVAIADVRTINPQINSNATKIDDDFTTINNDFELLKNTSDKTSKDARKIIDATQKDIEECQNQIEALSKTYKNSVKPQLKGSVNSIQKSLLEVENLLNYSSQSIENLANILHSYPDMMKMGKGNLSQTRAEVAKLQIDLRDIISDMEGLEENEQYKMLTKLIETDPEVIADFISDPVELNKEAIYGVDYNGSAMAPFYIILSIWVGGLILVAIIKTKVKPIPGLTNVKPWQKFLGRYIVFFLIGQLQTLITVLGAFFYVGIQCEHPILLWLGCSLSSMAFTLLQYALTFSFGSVGEAIAVILMVIQVAGSGGTFPVEVLPKVFQVLYKYMPFAYGMNSLREAIAGLYEYDYLWYMLGLIVYIGISILIGMIGMNSKKFEKFVERELDKQDVIG